MADNNSKTSLGTEETGGEEERMVERALVPKGEQQDAAVDQEIVSPQAAVPAEKSGSTSIPQLGNVAALRELTLSAMRKAADAANQAREANERAGKAELEAEKAKAEAAKVKAHAERMKSAADQVQKNASDALRTLDEKMELVRTLGADIESLWSTSEAVKQRHSAEMDAWRASLATETETWKKHVRAEVKAEVQDEVLQAVRAGAEAAAVKTAEEKVDYIFTDGFIDHLRTLNQSVAKPMVEEAVSDAMSNHKLELAEHKKELADQRKMVTGLDRDLQSLGAELSVSEDAMDEYGERQRKLAEKVEELAERVGETELLVGLRTTASLGSGRGNRGRGRPSD
ncbi:hypothetical protein NU195Hw_g5860t1 [Hortaea werneckii]